jgi:hypothetical protein
MYCWKNSWCGSGRACKLATWASTWCSGGPALPRACIKFQSYRYKNPRKLTPVSKISTTLKLVIARPLNWCDAVSMEAGSSRSGASSKCGGDSVEVARSRLGKLQASKCGGESVEAACSRFGASSCCAGELAEAARSCRPDSSAEVLAAVVATRWRRADSGCRSSCRS